MKRFALRIPSLLPSTLACLALVGTCIAGDTDLVKDRPLNEVPHLGPVHRTRNVVFRTAPTSGSTGAITPVIKYHNGNLIGTPVVYLIWYGNWNATNNSDTPQGQQIVRNFLNSIGGSPYFNINKSYSTAAQTITGKVTFGGEYSDTGSSGLNITDTSVDKIVQNAINKNKLPYNANGIYFVLSSSANVRKDGFCSQYCGWHDFSVSSFGRYRYGFIGNANQCLSSCAPQSAHSPNNNPGVDGMVSIIAHELVEATTDPDIDGWYDSRGDENGDKCAWTFGTTRLLPSGAYYNVTLGTYNYLIQRNLYRNTNGNNYCVLQ